MDVFSAIADPTRREIIELLARNGPLPAGAIYDHFPVSRPAVSQHLKILREAGLVKIEKRAQQRIYSVDPAGVQMLEAWAGGLARRWVERFDALDAVLQTEKKKTLNGS